MLIYSCYFFLCCPTKPFKSEIRDDCTSTSQLQEIASSCVQVAHMLNAASRRVISANMFYWVDQFSFTSFVYSKIWFLIKKLQNQRLNPIQLMKLDGLPHWVVLNAIFHFIKILKLLLNLKISTKKIQKCILPIDKMHKVIWILFPMFLVLCCLF